MSRKKEAAIVGRRSRSLRHELNERNLNAIQSQKGITLRYHSTTKLDKEQAQLKKENEQRCKFINEINDLYSDLEKKQTQIITNFIKQNTIYETYQQPMKGFEYQLKEIREIEFNKIEELLRIQTEHFNQVQEQIEDSQEILFYSKKDEVEEQSEFLKLTNISHNQEEKVVQQKQVLRDLDQEIDTLEYNLKQEEQALFTREGKNSQKEAICHILSGQLKTQVFFDNPNIHYYNGSLRFNREQIGTCDQILGYKINNVMCSPYSIDSLCDYIMDQINTYIRFYLTVQLTGDATQKALKKKSFSNENIRYLFVILINVPLQIQALLSEWLISEGYKIVLEVQQQNILVAQLSFQKQKHCVQLSFINGNEEQINQILTDIHLDLTLRKMHPQNSISEQIINKKPIVSLYYQINEFVESMESQLEIIKYLSELSTIKVTNSRAVFLNQY